MSEANLRQQLVEALRERDQARVERDDLRRRLDLRSSRLDRKAACDRLAKVRSDLSNCQMQVENLNAMYEVIDVLAGILSDVERSDCQIRDWARRLNEWPRLKSKPVFMRWGIWLKNVETWRSDGDHRSVFANEVDAKRIAELSDDEEARPLPLDMPPGQPVCPSCERNYGSPHAIGCSMSGVDDNGFRED